MSLPHSSVCYSETISPFNFSTPEMEQRPGRNLHIWLEEAPLLQFQSPTFSHSRLQIKHLTRTLTKTASQLFLLLAKATGGFLQGDCVLWPRQVLKWNLKAKLSIHLASSGMKSWVSCCSTTPINLYLPSRLFDHPSVYDEEQPMSW